MKENDIILSEDIDKAVKNAISNRRTDPLLEIGNPLEVIPGLRPVELYGVIKASGINDCAELLLYASTEQIQCFLDFDCWNRDSFLPANFFDWSSAITALGFEKTGQVFREMDEEILALVLLKSVVILNLKEVEVPEDDIDYYRTPDGFFELRPIEGINEDVWKNVVSIIESLYADNIEFAIEVLTKAAWEVELQLEENAYHWMSGRMEEQGFTNYLDALSVYRFLDPSSVTLNESSVGRLVGLKSDAIISTNLNWKASSAVLEAMAELENTEVDRVKMGIASLVNKMAIADGIRLDDEDSLEIVAQYASSTVNLGLEFITGGDAGKIPSALRSIAIERIFRAGYSLLLKLKGLAQTLSRSGHISLSPRSYTLLEGPWVKFYKAIVTEHPMLHLGLKGVGEERNFQSLRDLAFAGDIVEDMSTLKSVIFYGLEMNAALLTDEGISNTSRKTAAEITFGDLIRTALMLNYNKLPVHSIPTKDHINAWKEASQSLESASRNMMNIIKKNFIKNSLPSHPRLERILTTHLEPLYSGLEISGLIIYRV
ncbi:hypothetical protein KKF34_01440 [Myxococcota bacterium]|nr:hypothetical protein [Myxococcota bacterium]MBU1380066.1 hypothetical protein [Myxococcota bacterium]MBU1495524.1 hypothetical protein [Myxococcota bacterium]